VKGLLFVPISCTDDCIGYLPHYSQVGEGGYEDDKFINYFGYYGCFNKTKLSQFSDKLMSEARSLSI